MARYAGRVAMAAVCIAVVPSFLAWRGVAARGVEAPAQGGSVVRTLQPGQRLGAKPGEKGATYYAIEGRTRRLTTRFGKAVVVAERGADGDIQAAVRDTSGREVGRLRVNHLDATADALQFTTDAGAFLALGEPGVKMTMDWANRQAYSFSTDGVEGAASDVEWRGGMIRRRGAAARDLDREITQLETEWADGLTATTSRKPAARRRAIGNREFTGEVVVTRLSKDGLSVGSTNYYPREQVFTWDLPGLTKGSISAAQLSDYGGWPFTPDLEWMNVQAIAFHHFKSVIDKQRFVARGRPGWLQQVLQSIAPVVEANEPGCDGLHWLDGTVFRFCCDLHDACYSKYGCTSRSWWQVWTSWRCDMCNLMVVDCFEDGGLAIMY